MSESPFRIAIGLTACVSLCPACAQTKEVKAHFFDPVEWGQGQTHPPVIIGKDMTAVKSITVTPPDGITLGTPRETAPTEGEKRRQRNGWEVEVKVAADAALGKRAVRVTLEDGKIEKPIEIVPHVPAISGLVIGRRTSGFAGSSVEFEFRILDKGAGRAKKHEAIVGLERGGFAVFKMGLIWYRMPVRQSVEWVDGTFSFAGVSQVPGQAIGPFRDFQVHIVDKDKRRSNIARSTVIW